MSATEEHTRVEDLDPMALAMSAVSNHITTLLGVYVGSYDALPPADKFHRC